MAKSIIPKVQVQMKDGKPVLERKTKRQLLVSPVIFISEYRGLGVLSDDPKATKPVCRFTPFSVLHPTFGAISKGHYVCNTKEVFDILIEHPALDRGYKIVKRLPRETDRHGNVIMRGVSTGGGKELHELNEEQRGMFRHLTHLEAQYFTKESNYTMFKGNIKTESTKDRVMKEMDNIKNQLNLRS
jgi:hypothetical protein